MALEHLPEHILSHILTYVPLQPMTHTALVCKRFLETLETEQECWLNTRAVVSIDQHIHSFHYNSLVARRAPCIIITEYMLQKYSGEVDTGLLASFVTAHHKHMTGLYTPYFKELKDLLPDMTQCRELGLSFELSTKRLFLSLPLLKHNLQVLKLNPTQCSSQNYTTMFQAIGQMTKLKVLGLQYLISDKNASLCASTLALLPDLKVIDFNHGYYTNNGFNIILESLAHRLHDMYGFCMYNTYVKQPSIPDVDVSQEGLINLKCNSKRLKLIN